MSRLRLSESVGDFAGDKDQAARLREEVLKPAVRSGESVVLDFEGVDLATQSFIHALISDLVRDDDLNALDVLTFENCNPSVRELIEIVADYSQEDVTDEN
jgi:anti-anti-sigma regulatory factor